MFSFKLILICLMVVTCVLGMPFGEEVIDVIPIESDGAEDLGVDDLATAEHHRRGYGGYGGYGGYRGYGGYGGGYGGYGGYGHRHYGHGYYGRK
ncbi:neuropeptide-like protein 32 isoform X2 [Daphnia pulicaria]|uniref:neuropeptide-like protein 32 isoform X2 n=1 Tax=Daphnia pulicaria TaxID=35523 RepID=UPI001EEC6A24|nr:neuropeptide-like protein 32 isoform X2 [Daphnia pulicaria]